MTKPHYLKDPVAPVLDQLLGAAECVPALRDYVRGLQAELGDAKQTIIDLQGANAAYVRANSKLLAEALAKRIGVSPTFLCDILNGRREPSGKPVAFLGLTREVRYVRDADQPSGAQ